MGDLHLRNVSVKYGKIPALIDISISVNEGELVGLIGPNGAGKTTTLKCIFGLVAPSAGTVTYGDESLAGKPPELIVRTGLALVPEGRRILTTLTVAENLRLGQLGSMAKSADDLEEVLERFPILRKYYRSSAAGLSGGEQQQLAIARALLSRPRLLLLDEPSLGLAPLVVGELFDILAELRVRGVTILLVEQNAARTIALADRTYVLRSGQIVLHGAREDLLALEDIGAAYLGAKS